MKKILFILLVFAVLACSKKQSFSDQDTGKSKQSLVMSIADVQDLALKLPSTFSDDPQTRSSAKRIKEIVPFTKFKNNAPRTRSTDPDAPSLDDVYVVNYDNEQGFAIICADKRLPDVIGYSDSGSISDTMSNPGMIMVMELIPNYVATMAAPPIIIDSLPSEFDPNAGNGYWEHYETKYGEWTGITKGPLLATRWGQEYPFNYFLPVCSETVLGQTKMPIGCVPTAILQIMAYHKWPQSVNGTVSIHWDGYSQYGKDFDFHYIHQTSALVGVLEKILKMNYVCSGSYPDITVNEGDGFWKMQYDTKGHYGYKFLHVRTDIDNDLPLYIGGFRGGNWTGYKWGGHAWVIDGYKELTREASVYKTTYSTVGNNTTTNTYCVERSTEIKQLVHCNWGWDGSSNGWYLSDIFDVSKCEELDNPSDGQQTNKYYKYDLELLVDIKPKKP